MNRTAQGVKLNCFCYREWLRGVAASKTPSPSVFPKSFSLRPTFPQPICSEFKKKESLSQPSEPKIATVIESTPTSQQLSSSIKPAEQHSISIDGHPTLIMDNVPNPLFAQSSEFKEDVVGVSEIQNDVIKPSNVLKDSNKLKVESIPSRSPVSVSYKENVFSETIQTQTTENADDYLDWFMSYKAKNP